MTSSMSVAPSYSRARNSSRRARCIWNVYKDMPPVGGCAHIPSPEGSRTGAKRCDLWNEEEGVAVPAIVVLHRGGVVRYLYKGNDFADRPGVDEVFGALDVGAGSGESSANGAVEFQVSAEEAATSSVRPDRPAMPLEKLIPYYRGILHYRRSQTAVRRTQGPDRLQGGRPLPADGQGVFRRDPGDRRTELVTRREKLSGFSPGASAPRGRRSRRADRVARRRVRV
jgi:hypothetical protein